MGTFLVAQTSQMSDLNFRGRNWCWDKVPWSLTRRSDAQWREGKAEKELKVYAKVEASQRGKEGSCQAKQTVSS